MEEIIDKDNLKLEELRLIFERENTRKQNLENKASYFLVLISIIMTIICTYLNPEIFLKIRPGEIIILLIPFLISIGQCIRIFLPREYYHPFDLKNFNEFENSFKNENFKQALYDQYLTSINVNYNKNNDIMKHLKCSIYSFICFIIFLILIVVI